MIRIVHAEPHELAPYQEGLRRLEHDIRYPIADGADHFRIDHGDRYQNFFSALGEAHFLIALDGREVVGSFAGVLRQARVGERRVATIYGADLKIAKPYRGGRLSGRYLWRGFLQLIVRPHRWQLAYVAAMRGRRGDVTRAIGRIRITRLARPAAILQLYFVEPERLRRLDPTSCPPPPPETGIDLSPDAACSPPGLVSTEGKKDLWLESTGQRWPLVHLPLGPRAWRPSWGAYLRACGEAMSQGTSACFAIDERLSDHVAWLASAGITPGAVCTVYAMRSWGAPRLAPWVHMATSEI